MLNDFTEKNTGLSEVDKFVTEIISSIISMAAANINDNLKSSPKNKNVYMNQDEIVNLLTSILLKNKNKTKFKPFIIEVINGDNEKNKYLIYSEILFEDNGELYIIVDTEKIKENISPSYTYIPNIDIK